MNEANTPVGNSRQEKERVTGVGRNKERRGGGKGSKEGRQSGTFFFFNKFLFIECFQHVFDKQ